MITIRKEDFKRARADYPDYIGINPSEIEYNEKICKRGDWMAFEGAITGDWSTGTNLIFEHIHFEIV